MEEQIKTIPGSSVPLAPENPIEDGIVVPVSAEDVKQNEE